MYRRFVGLSRSRWRKLLCGFALPLMLVAAHLGALQHELSHYRLDPTRLDPTQNSRRQPQSPHGGDVCDLCVAFAQVAGGAAPHAAAPALRLDLVQHFASVEPIRSARRALPAERSRGPPSFL